MLDKRKFYIDGKWVDPVEKNDFEVINPCNEDPFAIISLGSKKDTDNAVKAAKVAFETWKETSKEERLGLLEKLLVVYKKRFGEISKGAFNFFARLSNNPVSFRTRSIVKLIL